MGSVPKFKLTTVLWFIWSCFLAASSAYLLALYQVLGTTPEFDITHFFNMNHPMEISLTTVAAIAFGASFVLPKLFSKTAANKNSKALAFTIQLVAIEVGIMCGFVLGVTKQDTSSALPFFFFGFILLLLNNPNRQVGNTVNPTLT